MGFDWEKAVGVPPRADDAGHSRIQLASVNDGGGGGTGGGDADLRISKTPWTSASGVADELHTATNNGLTDLKEASSGLAGGTEGFDCTAALNEIRATWEARLTAVRDECGRLHGTLAKTGKHFGEVDQHVGGRVGGVHVGNRPDWAR
ncbi:hypothetical protein [Streptomyces sp. CoH27]|uniref:hypothetical protein n=1 Tax=Streptomyces sp. CoH27 TaxID=2875763 RepID=UPI001CD7A218|nr:hypothetical protein [Streptomyces sp. CoH27]